MMPLKKGLHTSRHCQGKVPFLTNLESEGKSCHCLPSKFSLSRAAPALGLAPSTLNQRLAHNSTSVTWCDQVQDTYDHTIHKQVCPYKAGIHSGGLALLVLSTQTNHIRQTYAYTNTAGTHPSYQGQSTPLPDHITLSMQATSLLKILSSSQRPGQGDCRVPWSPAPHLAI